MTVSGKVDNYDLRFDFVDTTKGGTDVSLQSINGSKIRLMVNSEQVL